jgi:hypothetical protein
MYNKYTTTIIVRLPNTQDVIIYHLKVVHIAIPGERHSRIAKLITKSRFARDSHVAGRSQSTSGDNGEGCGPQEPRPPRATIAKSRSSRRARGTGAGQRDLGRMAREEARRTRNTGDNPRLTDEDGFPIKPTKSQEWVREHASMGSSFCKYYDCPTHNGWGSIDLPHKTRSWPRIETGDRNDSTQPKVQPGPEPDEPATTDLWGNDL